MHIDHMPLIITREAVPEDFDRYFAEAFEELGPESRHFRFFTAVRELPPGVLERLAHVDGMVDAAIIAFDAAADRFASIFSFSSQACPRRRPLRPSLRS